MAEYNYDYDAAASTIKIEDVTSDEINRNILRSLKENDPDWDELWVSKAKDGYDRDCNEYCPKFAHGVEWLGYFIGQNTTLEALYLHSNPFQGFDNNVIEGFFRGLNSNTSIQQVSFSNIDLSGGEIFSYLRPFFEINNKLSDLHVEECEFGAGCARQLSSILRGCSKSLKYFKIIHSETGDESDDEEIIEALGAHPQLEKLQLNNMNLGRSVHTMANILRGTATNLVRLSLYGNDIDDEGVDALMGALTNSVLSVLDLSYNRNITSRGCLSLTSLLKHPNSNLEELDLNGDNVRDEGALIFANALATNRKLKLLGLYKNGITTEGWSSFSKVLCDTSSVNNTFLSNHKLENLNEYASIGELPADVQSSLALNRRSEDKKVVAIKKILKHHQYFDMQPFFEWDLKVLPIAIHWFERALSIEPQQVRQVLRPLRPAYEAGINKRKLETIYQFIRAMPDVFEPVPVAGGEKRKRKAVDGLLK